MDEDVLTALIERKLYERKWFRDFMSNKETSKKDKPVKLSAMDEDVLTALIRRELYGLELLDILNLDRPTELGFGSLYPALNRLEKKGLVEWRWGDEVDESGGARRKYYKVNGYGDRALRELQEYRFKLSQRSADVTPNPA